MIILGYVICVLPTVIYLVIGATCFLLLNFFRYTTKVSYSTLLTQSLPSLLENHKKAGRESLCYNRWKQRNRYGHGKAVDGRGAYFIITVIAKARLIRQADWSAKTSLVFSGTCQTLRSDRSYATVKERQKGYIDILFANAGIWELSPLGEVSKTHFDKTTGIKANVLCSVSKTASAVSGRRRIFSQFECFGSRIQWETGLGFTTQPRGLNFIRLHLDGRFEATQNPGQLH